MPSVYFTVKWIFLLLLAGGCMKEVKCLRNVVMTIPEAVPSGESVVLQCHYDLEGDPLYTVKWYRGRSEFFRSG
ncbi:uncharacterized protein LOC113380863, partial [Ctenocephalides felis]|uniref:uncharacterized protein LOC113380863 n=1 Tax=Ctenocephalides felis TaxID=7515 RepID=UPI000E6E5319